MATLLKIMLHVTFLLATLLLIIYILLTLAAACLGGPVIIEGKSDECIFISSKLLSSGLWWFI